MVSLPESESHTVGILQDAQPGEVGFVRRGGHLAVALPKVYDAHLKRLAREPATLGRHAALLARVLRRYRDDLPQAESVQFGSIGSEAADLTDRGGLLDLLDAAAELQADYHRFGLFYVKNVREAADPSSPISWSRTIRQAPALISGDDVVYVETMHRSRRRDPFDLFHRLHASSVREALQLLGDPSGVPEDLTLDSYTFEEIRTGPESFLSPIRERMFRDRGRRLVDLVSQFLGASARAAAAEAEGNSSLHLTKDFEFVWEHMLRGVFENDDGRAIASLAAGRWHDARLSTLTTGIRPRADVLRAVAAQGGEQFKYVCVFDAKDKHITDTSGRSTSELDIYKQVVYARLLFGYPSERFLNVLVLPYLAIEPNQNEPVRLLGSHWWRTMQRSSVIEIGLDYVRVCEAFLFERALDAERIVAKVLAYDGGLIRQ